MTFPMNQPVVWPTELHVEAQAVFSLEIKRSKIWKVFEFSGHAAHLDRMVSPQPSTAMSCVAAMKVNMKNMNVSM